MAPTSSAAKLGQARTAVHVGSVGKTDIFIEEGDKIRYKSPFKLHIKDNSSSQRFIERRSQRGLQQFI